MKSKFDCMNFSDGSSDIEFVAHANKFTKEQAIELLKKENGERDDLDYSKLIVDIVKERTVRYFVRMPYYCGCDTDGGYTYCNRGERGSFPVWVIEFEDLKR